MINIAYLVHSLQAGGIERSVTRIVNRLDRTRFSPIIICLGKSGPAEQWLETEVPVLEIGKSPGNDLLAVRRLANCLRDNKVDLLQSHNWGTLLEAVVACMISKTAFHVHAERGTVLGRIASGGLRHWLRARTMAFALSRVDKVISNSHAVASRVQQRCGYRAERIAIIPNGVPEMCLNDREAIRHQMRAKLGLAPNSVLIGSVGRLEEVKGFANAVRAFADLLCRPPEVHLVLVGEGSERKNLEMLINDLGVSSNVHLVGRQENVDHWLAAIDIYLNSSLSEGMSQSIVEAMSAGLPIVATDVGDTAQVLGPADSRAGICVPAAETSALTKALLQLAADSELRELFGDKSKERHQCEYSEEILTKNYQNFYLSVVQGSEFSSGSHNEKVEAIKQQ